MFEGEAAIQAASQITDAELDDIDALVRQIANENRQGKGYKEADQAFHLLIAKATRNAAVFKTIEEICHVGDKSPECALLRATARTAKDNSVIDEH